MKKVEGTIEEIVHIGNSENGNSRWRMHLDEGQILRTASDANVNHKLGYFWQGRHVSVVLNGVGSVIQVEEL